MKNENTKTENWKITNEQVAVRVETSERKSLAENVLAVIDALDNYDDKVTVAEANAAGGIEQDYRAEQTIYTLHDGSKIVWEGSDWSIA